MTTSGSATVVRRSLSRALLRAVGQYSDLDVVPLGRILADQGQRSFAWSILLFAIVNLLPLPIGSNVVTAVPLLLLTGQMAFGCAHVRLPGVITRREVSRRGFQRAVLRLKPLLRPVERVIRPRPPLLFGPESERLVGVFLFVVSAALFLPIPFSGMLSATALLLTAMGMLERDGVVTCLGLALGAVAVLVTLAAATLLVLGVQNVI